MDINVLSLWVGILGFIVTISSLGYSVYATRQFSKGVRIGPLRSIRSLINRMEEEKKKHNGDSQQWQTMHLTQGDLDALFKNLQSMFNISDEDAPL
jgi:hypothetical protein